MCGDEVGKVFGGGLNILIKGGVKLFVGGDQLGGEVRSVRYLYHPYIEVSLEAFRKKSSLPPPSPRTKKNTKSCVCGFAPPPIWKNVYVYYDCCCNTSAKARAARF